MASGPQSSSPIVRVWIQYSHVVGTTGVLPTYTRLPIANTDLITGWLPSSVSGTGLGIQDIMITHNYSKPRVITSKQGQRSCDGVCAFSQYAREAINIHAVIFLLKQKTQSRSMFHIALFALLSFCPNRRFAIHPWHLP